MSKFEHSIDDPLDCEFIELEQPEDWQSSAKSHATRAECSRRATALSMGQKMSFDRKIDYSMRVVERAMTKKVKWAISYSAGSDSTVLSHIVVKRMRLNVPHIMSNTRLEYPETYRNAKVWKKWLSQFNVQLHMAIPDLRPDEVWAKHGLPLFSKEVASKYRQWRATGNWNHIKNHVPKYLWDKLVALDEAGIDLTDKCCDELKKKPMMAKDKELGITGHLTGTRCEESQARRLMYIQRGSLYNSTRNRMWLCHPLTHWTKGDIEHYKSQVGIRLESIPTETGRSGCVNCAFGCHIAQAMGQKNSLQILAERNPKMHAHTMSNHRFQEACDIAGIDTIHHRKIDGVVQLKMFNELHEQ